MSDQQISIRRVADELDISKTSLNKIMSDYSRIKKICTRWVLKLLTSLRRAHRVDCCEELLENCNQDQTGFLGRIVTRERDIDTPLQSTQSTRSKDLEETRRKDTNLPTSYTIG